MTHVNGTYSLYFPLTLSISLALTYSTLFPVPLHFPLHYCLKNITLHFLSEFVNRSEWPS